MRDNKRITHFFRESLMISIPDGFRPGDIENHRLRLRFINQTSSLLKESPQCEDKAMGHGPWRPCRPSFWIEKTRENYG